VPPVVTVVDDIFGEAVVDVQGSEPPWCSMAMGLVVKVKRVLM